MKKVDTTVIPAAGWGTRMLPLSATVAKEMLPLGDRPLLAHTIGEAQDAGVDKAVLITNPARSLISYFKPPQKLDSAAQKLKSNSSAIRQWLLLRQTVSVSEAPQQEALGLGHAVACARSVVTRMRGSGEEGFFVQLPDELLVSRPSILAKMKQVWKGADHAVVALMPVPEKDVFRYGIADCKASGESFPIRRVVEKPDPADAPSNLAIIGRYLLPYRIFDILEELKPGAGGEIQLTDAIDVLCREGKVSGVVYGGTRFDAGSLEGYQAAWRWFLDGGK